MKQWWQTLQTRERRLVLLGATALLAILSYVLVWEPFTGRLKTLDQRVAGQAELLTWMEQARDEVNRLRTALTGQTNQRNGRSLMAVIEATARANDVAKSIQRMEPDGASGVKVWMNNADYDRVTLWLGALEDKHGAHVQSLSATRSATEGTVDLQLQLGNL